MAAARTGIPVPNRALTAYEASDALPIWKKPIRPEAVAARPCLLAIAPETQSDKDEPFDKLTKNIGKTIPMAPERCSAWESRNATAPKIKQPTPAATIPSYDTRSIKFREMMFAKMIPTVKGTYKQPLTVSDKPSWWKIKGDCVK